MALDTSKAVCTRDGRPVRILSTNHRSIEDRHQYSYPIRAEVPHPNEPGKTVTWNYMACGRWKSNEPFNHNDLINEMPWHRWLNHLRGVILKEGARRVGH